MYFQVLSSTTFQVLSSNNSRSTCSTCIQVHVHVVKVVHVLESTGTKFSKIQRLLTRIFVKAWPRGAVRGARRDAVFGASKQKSRALIEKSGSITVLGIFKQLQ